VHRGGDQRSESTRQHPGLGCNVLDPASRPVAGTTTAAVAASLSRTVFAREVTSGVG